MKLLMGTLLAGLSVYGGAKLSETILPAASEATANVQGRVISDRAYLEYEMGATWDEALRVAVDSTRNNDGQLTVSGTTVRWDNGAGIWCIALPTPTSTVEPEECV